MRYKKCKSVVSLEEDIEEYGNARSFIEFERSREHLLYRYGYGH